MPTIANKYVLEIFLPRVVTGTDISTFKVGNCISGAGHLYAGI